MTEDARDRALTYSKTCGEYTPGYEQDKLVADWEQKEVSAQGVVKDFLKRVGSITGKKMLDIGFGNGTYARTFAEAGGIVFGLEINDLLLELAQRRVESSRYHVDLRIYDGMTFPYDDRTFDYVYSISVLEHTSYPELMLKESYRTLKKGGKMYLAFPNRLYFRETHTGVFFLSYLPRNVAAWVLKTFWGRTTVKDLNLHFISYWKLKHFIKHTGFRIRIESQGTGFRGLIKKILALFNLHHSVVLPHIMVILEKPSK